MADKVRTWVITLQGDTKNQDGLQSVQFLTSYGWSVGQMLSPGSGEVTIHLHPPVETASEQH